MLAVGEGSGAADAAAVAGGGAAVAMLVGVSGTALVASVAPPDGAVDAGAESFLHPENALTESAVRTTIDADRRLKTTNTREIELTR